MGQRIQKVLAAAGVAGRRTIESWIEDGRITVNGRPAEIGQSVEVDDKIRVDGRLIDHKRKSEASRVLLYRKKTGEVVTRSDPEGRPTIFRKLPKLESGRWIAVGRLDINTSGLILLTTDGELARRLTHPSFGMTRAYAVRVLGDVSEAVTRRLLSGVKLDDGMAKFSSLRLAEPPESESAGGSANHWFEVTLHEGRNRIVRRLFESQNLQVSRLIRIAYGPIALGRGIKAGGYREATEEELSALGQAVGLGAIAPSRRSVRKVAPADRTRLRTKKPKQPR